ncbi:MAG: PadR family transcriptional regulator [Candidatus Limnocylindria bacterium]
MPGQRRPSDTTRRVLDALAEACGWSYGYDLSRRTGVSSGSLYPILIRLAERGALTARWLPPERPGRPMRHGYRLTTRGVRLLESAREGSRGAPAPARRALHA